MLRIRTSSGRSLSVTGEHRIPVKTDDGMVIRRADEVRAGDTLYGIPETDAIRGETIEAIDLVRELSASVPPHLLENVYVRGAGDIFAGVVQTGKASSYTDISRALGVEHQEQWYTRGIMPITHFAALSHHYGIEDYGEVTIGSTGSGDELPAILTLTPELIRLLGFFTAEGNYNASPGARQYNPGIAWIAQALAIQEAATLTGGSPDTETIYWIKAVRSRAIEVTPGGELNHLLFRYVFGIPEGAAGKRLPGIVYHINDLLLHEFLSALFTGGGSVYYRPGKPDCFVNYATTSPVLRQELSLLLATLGITHRIVETCDEEGRPEFYRVEFTGREEIEALARYATFLDDRQDHIDGFLSAVKEGEREEQNETVVGVLPVESTGEYVYDLFLVGDGTEESHTFYASDGLLIHNCQDWDLRYFFYYGLMPDGNGTKASVAGPAKRAEVAVLHAVKALGSAQTNFAGGQGYYNFLTFMAPFLEGMEYEEVKQLMQMF
ncbi:MAG: anaerobic ribonucleoside-triphosphate reductase, partial [Methanomicrobiales archaeon]|nr:anaerobic ribonucleoside-triphosphate reductase [Methanomicrobiales archaeon]